MPKMQTAVPTTTKLYTAAFHIACSLLSNLPAGSQASLALYRAARGWGCNSSRAEQSRAQPPSLHAIVMQHPYRQASVFGRGLACLAGPSWQHRCRPRAGAAMSRHAQGTSANDDRPCRAGCSSALVRLTICTIHAPQTAVLPRRQWWGPLSCARDPANSIGPNAEAN